MAKLNKFGFKITKPHSAPSTAHRHKKPRSQVRAPAAQRHSAQPRVLARDRSTVARNTAGKARARQQNTQVFRDVIDLTQNSDDSDQDTELDDGRDQALARAAMSPVTSHYRAQAEASRIPADIEMVDLADSDTPVDYPPTNMLSGSIEGNRGEPVATPPRHCTAPAFEITHSFKSRNSAAFGPTIKIEAQDSVENDQEAQILFQFKCKTSESSPTLIKTEPDMAPTASPRTTTPARNAVRTTLPPSSPRGHNVNNEEIEPSRAYSTASTSAFTWDVLRNNVPMSRLPSPQGSLGAGQSTRPSRSAAGGITGLSRLTLAAGNNRSGQRIPTSSLVTASAAVDTVQESAATTPGGQHFNKLIGQMNRRNEAGYSIHTSRYFKKRLKVTGLSMARLLTFWEHLVIAKKGGTIFTGILPIAQEQAVLSAVNGELSGDQRFDLTETRNALNELMNQEFLMFAGGSVTIHHHGLGPMGLSDLHRSQIKDNTKWRKKTGSLMFG